MKADAIGICDGKDIDLDLLGIAIGILCALAIFAGLHSLQ